MGSPLKGGWLSGKFTKDAKPDGTTRVGKAEETGNVMQSAPSYTMFAEKESTWKLLDAMKSISERHQVSVSAIALRWLLQRPNVASIIIGARTMKHLEGNCVAASFELSEDDMTQLCQLS